MAHKEESLQSNIRNLEKFGLDFLGECAAPKQSSTHIGYLHSDFEYTQESYCHILHRTDMVQYQTVKVHPLHLHG